MLYDVFICHASEDKTFVRPLAKKLKGNHIEVWYDEFSLKIGDSLRRSIDYGITKSRYGIVVLSNNFFNKKWSQWELDGLVQRQNDSEMNIILPIWLNITKNEVLKYSPSLADKVAIIASKNINATVKQLLETIKPEGSTLIIARDILIDHGIEPPVVTDDWWLDVIEYSGTNPVEDTFQESMGWGRWGFPLPEKGNNSSSRGTRLAWAAMQMTWQQKAQKDHISQITHPDKVLDFINTQAGLKDTCFEFPHYLATYAPQLTIKGFGGNFEEVFENWHKKSLKVQKDKKENGSISGKGLTTNKNIPLCDEPIALRSSNFGNYCPSEIACFFVQGHLMGPPVKAYEIMDYIVWLLSSDSAWLPQKVKEFLLEGMKKWAMWPWTAHNNWEFPFDTNKSTGKLFNTMIAAKGKGLKLKNDAIDDLCSRIKFSVTQLNLSDKSENIVNNFLERGFIESWIQKNSKKYK